MAIKDDIKNLLDNSYELSRAEIAKKLGIDREQVRKPLTKLLEAKEIERRVEDGVEWFTSATEEHRVEPSRGSQVEDAVNEVDEGLKEIEEFSMERWNRGYKSGYEAAWEDVGMAIAKYLRKTLEIQPIEEQLDD